MLAVARSRARDCGLESWEEHLNRGVLVGIEEVAKIVQESRLLLLLLLLLLLWTIVYIAAQFLHLNRLPSATLPSPRTSSHKIA